MLLDAKFTVLQELNMDMGTYKTASKSKSNLGISRCFIYIFLLTNMLKFDIDSKYWHSFTVQQTN